MKRVIIYILITAAVVLGAIFWQRTNLSNEQTQQNPMIITSPSFENGGFIPKQYSCDGGDMNPELHIQNVPEKAKSLALIIHDPDAPLPGGFYHWLVWNIDPKTATVKEESVPSGSTEGTRTDGKVGYTGPCPPSGVHHYHFQLYALDDKLDLPETTGADDLLIDIAKHEIEKAELIGLYQR